MERTTQSATNDATETTKTSETHLHTKTIQNAQTTAAQTQMTSASYFHDMRQFLYNCRHDKRLTPATQLVYRVLVDLANANCWLYPFVVSNAELKEITHIGSDRTITSVKQRLKSLNYVQYEGNPSQYIVNSPPAQKVAQRVASSGAPQTPQYNTEIRKHKKKKKKLRKEERGLEDDRHYIEYDWRSDPRLDEFV